MLTAMGKLRLVPRDLEADAEYWLERVRQMLAPETKFRVARITALLKSKTG